MVEIHTKRLCVPSSKEDQQAFKKYSDSAVTEYPIDGDIEEIFAIDCNVGTDLDAGEQTLANKIMPANARQDLVDGIFDDLWCEISSEIVPLIKGLMLLKKPTDALPEDAYSVIDVIERSQSELPDLLAAMTIRPIPLQKRDYRART